MIEINYNIDSTKSKANILEKRLNFFLYANFVIYIYIKLLNIKTMTNDLSNINTILITTYIILIFIIFVTLCISVYFLFKNNKKDDVNNITFTISQFANPILPIQVTINIPPIQKTVKITVNISEINEVSSISNTEISDTEINEVSSISNTEINNTEISDTEINEVSSISDTEINNTEISDTEINEVSSISDTEINNTEISDTEINNTEINNTEISNIEISDTEINNTEISNIEINNTKISNISSIRNTEINNTEINNTEINNTEINNTEISNTEINEVSSINQDSSMEIVKEITSLFVVNINKREERSKPLITQFLRDNENKIIQYYQF
jgi:hypothetical protein